MYSAVQYYVHYTESSDKRADTMLYDANEQSTWWCCGCGNTPERYIGEISYLFVPSNMFWWTSVALAADRWKAVYQADERTTVPDLFFTGWLQLVAVTCSFEINIHPYTVTTTTVSIIFEYLIKYCSLLISSSLLVRIYSSKKPWPWKIQDISQECNLHRG